MCGVVFIGQICDRSQFGCRRYRAFEATAVVVILNVAVWSTLLWYLSTHNHSRTKVPNLIDWKTSGAAALLIIFTFLGLSWGTYQVYTQWLIFVFSNDPATLSQYSGFYQMIKFVGLAIAFGLDSRSTPFLTEAIVYSSVMASGSLLALVDAKAFLRNSMYGREPNVIVPRIFEDEAMSIPSVVTPHFCESEA